MQDRDPVIVIAIAQAVPAKVSPAIFIAGKAKKERGTIQAMLGSELGHLFRGGVLAEHGSRRVARHQFDQNADQRDYSPDYEDKQARAA